jgi:AraC family transcriptional regulator
MNVEVTTQPSMRVAAVRHHGAYAGISTAFAKLGEIGGEHGLFGPGATMLGLYHDDPQTTPESELRSDAAITLRDGAHAPPGLDELTVPGGRYARARHTGPYEGLPDAWMELMAWIGARGEQFGEGMSYELYHNNPGDTAPEDLVTDLFAPLA